MGGKKQRRFVFGIIGLVIILLLAACGPTAAPPPEAALTEAPETEESTAAPEPAPAGSTELVVAQKEPRTIDPHTGNDAGTWRLVVNVYEPLIGYKRGTVDLEGVLATDWEVSEDKKTYTFKLREGVNFHDGTPFNAEAVKFSLDRIKSINVGPAYILNNYVGSEIVDDYTINVNLSDPMPTFLSMLPRIFIASPTAIQEHEVEGDLAQAWMRENAAGTGPYKFESWSPGEQWVIVKNDDYWQGWPEKHITKVTLQFIPEVTTQRLLLEKGDLDIAALYSVDDLPALRNNPDVRVVETVALIQYYMAMSTVKEPLNDIRVRKAIAHAFDYETHVNEIMGGRAIRAVGPVPQVIPMHNPDVTVYEYDLERAKELLAEAGYPDGGFTLEFDYVQGLDEEKRSGELLQAGLSQLGIELNLQPMTWPTLLAKMQAPADEAPDIYGFYIYPAYPDPDAYLYNQYHSEQIGTANNGMYYSNERVDELLDEGLIVLDPAKRSEIYAEAQKLIADDSPAIFVDIPKAVIPMRSWVEGFLYTPAFNETYFFYGMYLEGKPAES